MNIYICVYVVVALVAAGCGGDKPVAGLSQQLRATNPDDTCQRLTPVADILSADDRAKMPNAEHFSPPVLDGEDEIIDHVSGKSLGMSRFSVNTRWLEDVAGVGNGHLGTDYDVVAPRIACHATDSATKACVDPEDPRFPVRAIADGVVTYAGYVCSSDDGTQPATKVMTGEYSWGIMVRILHRRKKPDGTTQYYLSVYAHLEGDTDGGRGLEKLAVRVGDNVKERQIIANVGATRAGSGGLKWNMHLHHEVRKVDPVEADSDNLNALDRAGPGYKSSLKGVVNPVWLRYANPSDLFAEFGYDAHAGKKTDDYPVGTVAYTTAWRDGSMRKDFYAVCATGTLCKIRDEAAFDANRMYLDAKDKWSFAPEISGEAKACFVDGNEITSSTSSAAVTCGSDAYVAFKGPDRNVKRRINAEPSTAAYRILLRSWGFQPADVRTAIPECIYTDGPPLTLRDGTVIESASDNDFYVVTNGGKAQRLLRNTFLLMGYPFASVIQVPDGSIPVLVASVDPLHREFTEKDAMFCQHKTASGGGEPGGTTMSAPVPSPKPESPFPPLSTNSRERTYAGKCLPGRRTCNGTDWRISCLQDPANGNATYWVAWSCGEGFACRLEDGRCVPTPVSVPVPAPAPTPIPTPTVPSTPYVDWPAGDASAVRIEMRSDGTLCIVVRADRFTSPNDTPTAPEDLRIAGTLPKTDWSGNTALEVLADDTARYCVAASLYVKGAPYPGSPSVDYDLPYRFGLVRSTDHAWLSAGNASGGLLWTGIDDAGNCATGLAFVINQDGAIVKGGMLSPGCDPTPAPLPAPNPAPDSTLAPTPVQTPVSGAAVVTVKLTTDAVMFRIRPVALRFESGRTPAALCLAGDLPTIDWNGSPFVIQMDGSLVKTVPRGLFVNGLPYHGGVGGTDLPYRFGIKDCAATDWAVFDAASAGTLWWTGGVIGTGGIVTCTASLALAFDVTGNMLAGTSLSRPCK